MISRRFGRAFYEEERCTQADAVERGRHQVAVAFAVERARVGAMQPVVPVPTEPIRRDQALRMHNRYGCIVGSAEHAAAVKRAADAGAAAACKRSASEAAFWAKHRPAVLDAEDTLSEAASIDDLKVGQLKAIVLSRTGHQPKSKNNNDGALLAEAAAAVRDHPATCMPA